MNLVPRAHAAHVLVIDDDLDLLRLLSMRLHARGFRVSTAASAEEGLARIAVEPPQLVVSDIRLPGQDGLALLARTGSPCSTRSARRDRPCR